LSVSLLLARLALAAVFAVAAIAKLADQAGSRSSAEVFGVPRRLAPAVAFAVPCCELAVAAALLTAGLAGVGALAGLVLLVAFTGVIARSMRRGEAPDCHCFGQLAAKPVGAATLIRNAGLAAVAGAIAIAGSSDPGPSGVAWLGRLGGSGATALGLGIAVATLGGLGIAGFAGLVRAHGRLLVRVDELEARLAGDWPDFTGELAVGGLPVGAQAPAFALGGLYGETATLAALTAADRPLLVLFTDPDCGPCDDLLPEVAAWQQRHAGTLTIVPISRGGLRENRGLADEHGLTGVLVDPDLEAYEAFGVNGTPSAVLVDPGGRVAAPAAGGAEEIAGLVDLALAGFASPTRVRPRPPTAGGPRLIGSRRR
jgi:peroxiredoxin